MGHRKPRLAFFIILLCVLQGRFPWWGADALGESGSVHWITLETAEATPTPTVPPGESGSVQRITLETAEATPMPTAGAETGRHRPVYTRRPHRHGAGIARHPRGTRPATAGRRRAENTLLCRHRRRCAAHHRRLAGALRRIRQALSGQPGRFMGNGHAGSAVPIGKRLLGVAWALPGGAPLPDAIDWQLPSHALPGARCGESIGAGIGPLYCWRCSRYPHRRRLRRQVAVPGSRGWREGHAPCMQGVLHTGQRAPLA